MTREEAWLQRRCGKITASELGCITSASGSIIEGNLTYVRSKRFERKHGFALTVNARPLTIGNETEPLIFEWLKTNRINGIDPSTLVYAKDESLVEIPFWENPDVPNFGASPDCYTKDESIVFEFKTLVGNEATEFFMDEYTSKVDKMARVLKEHCDQICGQFLANPKVQKIYLIKYAPQRDDIPRDFDSPLAAWRGIVFEFRREDMASAIEYMRIRIALFNAFIDSKINPSDLKKGYALRDGKLVKIEG